MIEDTLKDFEDVVKAMYHEGYSAVELIDRVTRTITTLETEKKRKRNNLQVLLNDLSHFIEDHYNYKVDDCALDIFADNLIYWLDAAYDGGSFTIEDVIEEFGEIDI